MRQRSIQEFVHNASIGCQGEGYRGSTTTIQAAGWERTFIDHFAKGGQPLPEDSGPRQRTPFYTAVQKHSFKRACKRALRYGSTMYHGKVYTPADFPPQLLHSMKTPATGLKELTTPVTLHRKAARLRLLCWNSGGMSQGKLLELRLWLCQQPYDVVILPETKWSYNRCWQDEKWHYIHTATETSRVGGILIMIARSLISAEHIGYDAVVPGRLLHVRLHYVRHAIDLIAVYQHAAASSYQHIQQREIFWKTLDDLFYRIPHRNQLICGGDFNCATSAMPPWIGTNTFKWKGQQHAGHQHRDMQRLGQILQRHSLTAANSWSAATGPSSYFHSDYAARIDYFLLRLQSCDGIAKQAHYLNQAEFLPLNQTHHFPLVCTIPKKHMIFQSKQFAPACSYRQRAQCRSASEQETDGWIALSQEVAHQCNRYLSQAPQSQTCIHDLHQDILPFFKQLFPGKPPTFSNTDQSAVHLPIENKWMHRKCIQNISHQQGSHGLHACLKAWYHWGRFRSLQRQQQRSIRQARAQRFATLCTEATAAAHLHDSHTLFQIINRHTPKRPITKARLKTDDGRIADQYMAHALTVQHVQQTWQGADTLQPLSDQPPGVPMEVQDIEQAIMTLHPNKSVAGPYLPAIIWKSAPKELAALIHQLLTRWWSCADPYIPPEWRDAWLFFLPKPGKPCTHPSQLRPISLMERIGKLVLGILTEKLKRFHQDHLCSEPQFGFLPKRSALDAIARVTRHCNLIRTLVAMQRRTFARQRTTKPEHTFCGGLQLLLDLRQAFDTVNRPRLFRFLQQRGTPTDLLHIISSWHMDTHDNLIHNNTTTRIPVNVGLRQGCKAAPILWVLFMSHFGIVARAYRPSLAARSTDNVCRRHTPRGHVLQQNRVPTGVDSTGPYFRCTRINATSAVLRQDFCHISHSGFKCDQRSQRSSRASKDWHGYSTSTWETTTQRYTLESIWKIPGHCRLIWHIWTFDLEASHESCQNCICATEMLVQKQTIFHTA